MLLSADGIAPSAPVPSKVAHAPAEIVVLDENPAAKAIVTQDPKEDTLVDTTAPVSVTATAPAETETARVAPVAKTPANDTPAPTNEVAPVNPDIQTATDLLVTTLTAGNGPPASGLNYSVGSVEDFSAWDPPLGGFNFTATDPVQATRDADYTALTKLFDGTNNNSVTLLGQIDKASDDGSTGPGATYSLGQLTLNGTLKFDWVSGTGASRILSVSFASLDSATFASGGVSLGLVVGKGAFLISGDLANPYTTGGLAGKMNVTGISMTTGGGSTTLAFSDPTGGTLSAVLSLNTAGAAAAAAATATTGINSQVFDYTGMASFLQVAGNISVNVTTSAVSVKLSGDFTFAVKPVSGGSTLTFGLNNGKAELTVGTVTLAANGLSGAFLINSAGVAGWATVGSISASGLPTGFSFTDFSGIKVDLNTTGNDVSTSIPVGGGSNAISYSGSTERNFFRVTGTVGVNVAIGSINAKIKGTFTFDRSTDSVSHAVILRAALVGGSTSFTAGGSTLDITGINGAFVFLPSGLAGKASVGGIELHGITGLTFQLLNVYFEINTTNSDVSQSIATGGSPVILDFTAPDGTQRQFFKVSGNVNLGISLGGVSGSVSGGVYFEQITLPDTTKVVKFAVTDATATFTAGSITGTVAHVTGGFIINAAGVAGFLHAHASDNSNVFAITGVPGVTVSATALDFSINTTGVDAAATFDVGSQHVAFNYVAANDQGTFLHVGGTVALGVAFGSFATTVNGTFTFEQTSSKILVGIRDGNFELAAGPLKLEITKVNGLFALYPGTPDDPATVGVDETTTGTIAMKLEIGKIDLAGIPGLTFNVQDFFLEYNNTGLTVSEAFSFADDGDAATDDNPTLSFTGDILTFGGTAHLVVSLGGGAFSTTINGTFTIEQSSTKILVGVRNANFELAAGPLKLDISEVNGLFALYPGAVDDPATVGVDESTAGTVAMKLSVGKVDLTGITGLTFDVTNFFLEYNNTGRTLTETFNFADDHDATTDDHPVMSFTGNILSLGGTVHLGVSLGGGAFSTTITGTFTIEQTSTKILIGVRDASFELAAGPLKLDISKVNGLFALYPGAVDDPATVGVDESTAGTIAMKLSVGKVVLTGITGLTFDVSNFFLEYNNTGGTVTETFNFADDHDATTDDHPVMSFTGDVLSLGGTVHLGVSLGGGAFSTTIIGTFTIEQTSTKILIGVRAASFELAAGPLKLEISEVNGLFALYPGAADDPATVGVDESTEGTIAMQLSVGRVDLTGITGLTFNVSNFFLNYNNTGGHVSETFNFADDHDATTDDHPVMSFTGDVLSLGGTVHLGVSLGGGAFATTIIGTFTIEQTSAKILVGIRNASFELAAGPLKLEISKVNGLFALYPGTADDPATVGVDESTEGTIAMQLSVGKVDLTGITGLTFGVENFFLNYNNTGGHVSETFNFADDHDATTDDHPVMSFDDDILALGGTVHLGVSFGGGAFATTINGTFTIEQTSTKILVGIRDANFELAAGPLKLEISKVNGLFALYPGTPDDPATVGVDESTNGTIAMELSVGKVELTGITGLTFEVENFFLKYNNAGAKSETFHFADDGDATTDDNPVLAYTDNILALGGTVHLGIAFGSAFSTTINGTFTFEQTSTKILVGVRDGSFDLKAGPVKLEITKVNGLFALYPGTADDPATVGVDESTEGTIAMQLAVGKVKLTGITGLDFQVSNFFLQYSNVGGPVTETFNFADDGDATTDDHPTLNFDDDILSIAGTVHLSVALGGFRASLDGSFMFEQTATSVKIGLLDAGMTVTVAGVLGFDITHVDGAIVLYGGVDDHDPATDDGTMAMQLKIGHVGLTGVPAGFTFTATNFFFNYNNHGVVHETFQFHDAASTLVHVDFDANTLVFGGSIKIVVGTYLTIQATNIVVDTTATGSDHLFQAQLLSGTLNIPALGPITVEVHNLAITASGHIANYLDTHGVEQDFVVEVTFGGSGPAAPGASGFQWPSWFPIKLQYLKLKWDDISGHPADFILTISATVDLVIPGLTFSGMVQNLEVDVGKLTRGEFPILGFDAAGVSITGNLFGMTVSGSLVMGMISVDTTNHEVDATAHPELVDHKLLYAGFSLSVNIAGIGGAQFAVGLASISGEIVPLEAMLGVTAPIIIEPITGLTLGAFAGRVQFATKLTDIADYTNVNNLKTVAENPGSAITPDLATWAAGLKSATLRIAQGDNTGAGPANVWAQTMTITVLASFYSSYVSANSMNGTMVVKFDTEGRILLAGQLSFGDPDGVGSQPGQLTLSAGMYADLTQAASSNFSFSFYASYGPTLGPKLFVIEASLKVEILKNTLDANGDNEVWHKGTDPDSEKAFLSLKFTGKVKFVAGGAMVVQVDGEVDLQVALVGLNVRLRFAAQIGVTDPTPNPLGADFGDAAGYVTIYNDASGHFQMYGAVKVDFKPDTLKQYGIDVRATVFLQINTTATEQAVDLKYLNGIVEHVVLRASSFSLYVKGDLNVGVPNSAPTDAFLKISGFVIIEIDANGLTLVFDVDVHLAPGGTELLKLKATGFMRINGDGIAARLDMHLDATTGGNMPPSSGLAFTAAFTLVINTTGKIVHYDIPAFVLTGAPGEVTSITIAQAAPVIGGDLSVAEDIDHDPTTVTPGSTYFLISATGSLKAFGTIELDGDFFILITSTKVQLQVNATINFANIGDLAVHGFLEISDTGAAGILSISTNIDLPGIQVTDAKFILAFNTYTHEYELPEAVATQFGLPYDATAPPTLGAHLIRIEISGKVLIGGTLELSGRFFFEQVTDTTTGSVTTTVSVAATMSLPILGSLTVNGDLVIYDGLSDHEGAVGSLVINLSAGNKSALTAIGITDLSVVARLKVNTTNFALDDPGIAGTTDLIDANTISLDLSGSLKVVGIFTFTGHFFFSKSATELRIEFDATLSIVIGTFHATGFFNSSAAGFQGLLTLTAQPSSTLASMGFDISGSFLLAINSTSSVMTLHDLDASLSEFNGKTVDAHGLKIYVKGQLKILGGFFSIQGRFELSQGPGYLEISIDASIDLAGIVSLQVGGFAGIYDDNPATTTVNEGGLVLSFDAHANLNLASVITGNADFAFRLNTTKIARTVPTTGETLNSGYFRVAVTNLDASFLGLLKVTGALDITYDGTSVLKVTFAAKVDFFSIATIDLTGSADSTGKYDITFDGSLTIGISGFFGIGGTIHFHIKGEGEGITLIEGRITGTAWLIGIGFGVDVGISWDADSGRLRASISLRLNFFLFSITIRGNFDLGYIKSTITYQAGTADDTRVGSGTDFPGGELWVNVGDRAETDLGHVSTTGRNYSEDEINEQVLISQLAPGVIQVDLFGKKKQYNNVTSVHINTGSGNDFVYVDSTVTVPVFIDLGDGDDVASIDAANVNNSITIWGGAGNDNITGGGGAETIYGGDGDDYITGGGGNDTIYGGNGSDVIEGGTGVDAVYGEAGDDSFIWNSGDGQDSTISGGAGSNSLSINGDNNANTLTVAARGSDFDATIDGSKLSPTSVNALFASLNGGADTVNLGLLDSTILDTVNLSLGYNDNAADTVTIAGSATADYYHLKSVDTTADRPVSTSYVGGVQNTTFASVTTTEIQIAKTSGADVTSAGLINYSIDEAGYANDRVVINAGDGDDNIDASDVVATTIKFTFNGENGNDTLVGSNGADELNSGAGDDTVTGGPGADTFSDTGGSDTLIEQMDRDFTLNGWTLTSAGEVEDLSPAAFETIRLTGGNSANTFTISDLRATTLWLDGGEHNDVYTINIRGSGTSTINVFDGGTGGPGGTTYPNTDTLNVNGTSGDDTFLIRDGVITAGDPATSHAEVITYGGINGFAIHGGDGRDSFTVDDIRGSGAIYGDAGDDSFVVGRIVAAKVNGVMPPKPVGVQTIATTRGWLTYGNYAEFSIYGGDGDDYFEVNHNQAELKLYGENGDDVFWVKTYLEEGSALSTVAGGTGANLIRYVANGPLKIDGGAGFDRIILEGTEADDIFVITDTQIFGGGRQIDYTNIEGIVILGVGGNDTFYVLGNNLPLEIQGGTGNDTVYVGGQAPDYVYDAPAYIVDPPAYIDHYDPVWTTPAPLVITIPAHWEPVRWAGITWWWNWVDTFTISIPRLPYISAWTPVWVDPPAYTVDPNPVTYRFKPVTQFNGVVNGVESYNWAGPRDYSKSLADDPNNPLRGGATPTPSATKNIGLISAPVKFVGGDDPGSATPENDRLIVDLGTSLADLTATMQTVDEIITDYNFDTHVETLTNKGPIGQLLGLNLPNSVTSGGRTFMGGITFLGVETSQFNFGSGNDTFNLDGSFGGVDITVNGGSGNDTFNVKADSGDLVLNGNGGNDTFNLGSTVPATTNGTLNNITGHVTLDGGANTDTLYLDDRLDTDANTLNLTASTITGLGLTGGVNYVGFDGLTIFLGSGDDLANLHDTGPPLTLNTGGGNDQVFVGSSAGLGNTNGTLSTIGNTMTIDGGTGGATVTLDDTGDGSANTGTLTSTTLTGLGLGGVLTYANLSNLIVNLGGGGNTFTIASTHTAATNVSTGGGNDTVTINTVAGATNVSSGSGDDIFRVGSLAPTMTLGNLNGIAGLLALDGGANVNQLVLDDTGDTFANTGSMSASTVRGLGMAQGINYTNFASFLLSLGSGGDTFTMASTIPGATTVDLGAGDNTFTMSNSAGTLTVNAGGGNDTFNIRGSGGTVTLNGGAGNDTFNFGSVAPGTPGTLNNVLGVMVVNGGIGNDALNLDDSIDNIANVLLLTNTTITGLGLTGGITYGTFENLSILFGTGDDTAYIRSIGNLTPTFVNLGGGLDQVFIGSNAGQGNTSGSLVTIASTLTLDGGGSGANGATVTLDDTGDATPNTGVLTSTTITGLGLATSVTYSRLTTLNINLGNGGNTFTIASTHTATTNLNTGNGSDVVAIRTVSGPTNVNTVGGDDIVRVGSLAPAITGGTLNGISGLLSLDAGVGINQLFFDDTVDTAANTGALTDTTLRGLDMAQGVNYLNFAILTLGLGAGADTFTITSTHVGITNLDLGPGDDTLDIVSIAGLTNVTGNTGADSIWVNLAPTGPPNVTQNVTTNPIGAVLNLDGGIGGDQYYIGFSGAASSVINVHDTGALDPTVGGARNNLTIYDTPRDDTVLFRKEFVAMLQYDSTGAQLPTHEQINYNTAIDGVLTVTSVGGANYFAFDDNSSVTVVNGANEGDTVQIGQIFGNAFIGAGLDPVNEMIATTRGLISPGITHELTLNGGTGNDVFSVYHNRAKLNLNGGDGDDVFVIRSFALASSVGGKEVFDAQRGDTKVDTGGGVNKVSYALSAPVAIDGGNGFNSLVVIGTEFADNIVVTPTGVFGGGLQVTFTNIQQLVINLAEGNDNIWILGTPAGTALRVVGGLGSDTVYLGGDPPPMDFFLGVDAAHHDIIQSIDFAAVHNLAGIQGPILIEGGLGNGVPNLEPGVGLPGEVTGPLPDLGNANLNVDENLQVDRLVIDDTGSTADQTGVLAADQLTGLGLIGNTVIGGVAFDAGVSYLEMEEVILQLGSGRDNLTIQSTHEGRTVVQGNDGDDTINVQSISGHTTILGGNGNDTVNVGSLAPGTGGNLDGIDALLTIDGGAGTDTVNVDQRGNTAGSTGTLTQTALTGLEMTSALATVNDTVSFRVNNPAASYTLSYGGNSVTLAGNATANDITAALVNPLASGGLNLGVRNAVVTQVGDEFIINFEGGLRSNPVNLAVTGDVTLTHRTDGVNYYGVETLNLDLGSGADVMNVRGTAAATVTNLNTHDGEDRIYVSSTASLTTSTFTDQLLGSLDNVTGLLNIDAGADRNLLMVSDEASSVANGTLGTPALLTNNFLRGFAPAQINYTATAGNFAQGITVWTGAGADIINVTSTDIRAGVRTTTTLNTGAGNDNVTVALSAATDDLFAVNTQDGDDTVDASTSTLPILIFGGAGNDTLTGGIAGDLIFGDNGRVQYLDGTTVVAQIGGGGPGDFTDGITRNDYTLFTVDSAIGGVDTINGLTGNDLIFGGAAGDTINGNEGDNVVFGDHGTVTVVAGIVTSATTSTAVSGGADTITTGSGRDFILGGEAGDNIDAGAGDDAIAGDHGTFTITSPTAFSFTSTDFTIGGADTIVGGTGDDTIIGGADNDILTDNNGRNLVLGDHGTVVWDSSTGSFTVTSTAESTGGNDTITTGIDADVILGGAGSDTITSGAGDDLVFGDAGTVTVTANLPVVASTTAPGSGTGDTITTNDGADTILGGDGDDTIDAGNGANLVLGDYGTINWTGALRRLATATSQGTGGSDTITTGIDDDLILGGNAGDLIHAGAGDDVIVGDQGVITFTGGLALQVVNAHAAGDGNDQLFGESGNDAILGGGGDDTIDAGEGNNTVVGDHATLLRAVNGSLLSTVSVTSADLGSGGNDTITTGSGTDFILGGAGDDHVNAGEGLNAVLGDEGTISTTGFILTSLVTSTTFGGNDTLAAGSGTNYLVGGLGSDTITAAGGVNIILGDEGQVIVNGATLISATTLDANTGAADTITGATGQYWIFGGDGGDTITTADGFSAVFGDHGRIDLTPAGVLTLVSIDFASGGDDTITTGAGDDLILGGFGSDTINGGEGNNVVLGDHGQIIKTAAGLSSITTLAPTEGAADTITTGAGNDIILGGAGADVIHAGAGRNIVLGDHGRIDLVAGDARLITVSDYLIGGADIIDAGLGDDLIMGGFGADQIDAGDGQNIVLGDQGTANIAAGVPIDVYTEQPAVGAADIITTGSGNDTILGGLGADTIHAGEGDNFIVGDHAELHWVAGILARMLSIDFADGSADSIFSGSGADVILAGPDDDTVDAGDGNNIVFGDNGEIYWTAGIIDQATTVETPVGGNDTLTAGAGNDLVFGGTLDDVINAGNGDNVVFGDHGEALYSGGVIVSYTTFAPEDAGNDTITSGTGNDTVLAGAGHDVVTISGGNNVVFGDEAALTYSGGILVEAISITFDQGAPDTISTGAGNDLVVGGYDADTINGGDGSNVILGDNADAVYSGGLAIFFQTLHPEYSANDTITTGNGRDVILGGQGADTISAGDGDDLVIGDEGSVTLAAGVVQQITTESFASGMADTIFGQGGNDLILGGNGADFIDGGEGNNVIAGDNAMATLPGGILAQVAILAPAIGSPDTIVAGAGNDVILGGTAGDTINAGNGDNVVAGDQATITFLGGQFATLTPTTPGIGGNDTITTGAGNDRIVAGTGADWVNAGDGNNVVVGDHAIIIQNLGALTSVESVAFADGGADLIFTGAGNDLVIGGTAGDTIHGGAGNDLLFGDHALVTGNIDLSLLPLAMPVHPFTFTSISTQNVGADGRSVAGDDVIFADAGDDIVLGQEGNDILFGGDGDDDLIGGHNVSLGQDGDDVIDGGAGYDVLAGDNASILRRGDNISPRAHVLAGDAMFDDHGNLLDLDTPQAWPTAVPERDTIILDHAADTIAGVYGNDQLVGGAGDDVIFGELGNDQLHGDATLPVTIAADGTIDRTALRATATALFTTNLWVGADTDGDDYIEGNGGNDLIFGGLGQDDIVGGSSSLFGLTTSAQRPDGSDTIYGGNGTAASDQSDSDSSVDGRSRDADVIMGDNADIIRLVGINGVNAGAFLTFSYAAGAHQIIVRGFNLLDYSTPESPSDIGAADKIYGEAGDDTLHGEVGDDLMYGNGNDDNLYGGQGDDNLFGGAGDDSLSPSDELKAPPPAQGQAGAAEGNGAEGTTPGTVVLNLPGNIQATLAVDVATGQAFYVFPKIVYTGFSNSPLTTINSHQSLSQTSNGSWHIFASSVVPAGQFGNFASDANEPVGFDKLNEPAGAPPADGSQPQPPADGSDQSTPPAGNGDQPVTPPADGGNQPANSGDQPPAAPADGSPKDDDKPAEPKTDSPPPAAGDIAPPAGGDTPPPPPPTT